MPMLMLMLVLVLMLILYLCVCYFQAFFTIKYAWLTAYARRNPRVYTRTTS